MDTVRAESAAMSRSLASSVLRNASRRCNVATRAPAVCDNCLASSGAERMLTAVSISFGISMAKLTSPATEAAAPSASIAVVVVSAELTDGEVVRGK